MCKYIMKGIVYMNVSNSFISYNLSDIIAFECVQIYIKSIRTIFVENVGSTCMKLMLKYCGRKEYTISN